ncbi:C-type lectin domain family 4 member M [Hyalella azteca]|uniref:C-type lectin domain family 4 member M n=1 Tax=Hyalella azteca TaxID=294128 RepID=A0A8B7NDU4_HYAAZ|nr:C-type lectin domain family 4 member M [Hyalella azteca]
MLRNEKNNSSQSMQIYMLVCVLLLVMATSGSTTPSEAPDPHTSSSTSLHEVQNQLERLRAELYLEKRFRVEVQSLAAVNAESLRRLQITSQVTARETRDSVAQLRREQRALQSLIMERTNTTDVKTRIDKLEQGFSELSRSVRLMEVSPALLLFQERSGVSDQVTFNLTQAINSLAQRVTANEEYQLLLQSSFEEAESSFNHKLKHRFRTLKNDLDSRIRDYNAALTTFASDIRLLRQEIEQNVINIQTNVAVESRKVSDSLHILESRANQTKDEFQESLYYVAKAQQEQSAYRQELVLQILDIKAQTDELATSLVQMDAQLGNVSSIVLQLMKDHKENHDEIKPEVSCPSPYLKSESSCFSVLEEPLSWSAARRRCQLLARSLGGEGDLAVAKHDTHPVRSFVRNNVRDLPGEPYVWVGASSPSGASNWSWVDETPMNLDLFPWGRGEPDPSSDQPFLCVRISGAALFHNCLRSSELYSVCQLLTVPIIDENVTLRVLSENNPEDGHELPGMDNGEQPFHRKQTLVREEHQGNQVLAADDYFDYE